MSFDLSFKEAYDQGTEEIALKVFTKLINGGMSAEKAQEIVNITDEQLEKFLQIIKETV
ncbi:hypothetical protein [Sporofaciens sp. SGI.106]|uniref:hypothetical protein n=1 Tax=Sporofaciens sp. SGI.106 TaxID=3420568 RepID=UPI003CFF2F78